MTHDADSAGGFFSQPRAVWAVAFAAVVSFMGLGLVDPVLPARSSSALTRATRSSPPR